MPDDFSKMRSADFLDWCSGIEVRGLRRETFQGILRYLLSKQTKFGAWEGDGDRWEVVQTSVVLQSLANMKFRIGDSWTFTRQDVQVSGSIASALKFLEKELTERSTDHVGEDIWDASQAILAVAAFGHDTLGWPHVKSIAKDWEQLYQASLESEVRWGGPAYLAALIDVILRYEPQLKEDGQAYNLQAMTAKLLSEEESVDGCPIGMFAANHNDTNINRWTTSLVLRTLCSLPDIDINLIVRCVSYILGELRKTGFMTNLAEAPMYVARCLEALLAARPLLKRSRRDEIDAELVKGNRRLNDFWNEDNQLRTGNLKSYTAVAEYLGSLQVNVPAGLIFGLPVAKPPAPGSESDDSEEGIFIVHGHDINSVNELQLYLSDKLKLSKPVVLGKLSLGGATIIEAFEEKSAKASIVFVLLTPDDLGGTTDQDTARRARQNVIFEMGYFVAKLGRRSGRVILLRKGELEMPSDLGGILYIDISTGIESAGEKIRDALAVIQSA